MGFLSDCVSTDAPACELFIVQFNFASKAKEMRDRVFHAVLSVDSNPVKIKGAPLDVLLDDDEVKSILDSLGVGIFHRDFPDLLRLDNLRYGKIIIVTEPTEEGTYIRAQVVSLFHRLLCPVMAAGHVYVVPSESWGSMTDEEFQAKVMDPGARRLVHIPPAKSIKEALAILIASDM